jgi:hypothetical protein
MFLWNTGVQASCHECVCSLRIEIRLMEQLPEGASLIEAQLEAFYRMFHIWQLLSPARVTEKPLEVKVKSSLD